MPLQVASEVREFKFDLNEEEADFLDWCMTERYQRQSWKDICVKFEYSVGRLTHSSLLEYWHFHRRSNAAFARPAAPPRTGDSALDILADTGICPVMNEFMAQVDNAIKDGGSTTYVIIAALYSERYPGMTMTAHSLFQSIYPYMLAREQRGRDATASTGQGTLHYSQRMLYERFRKVPGSAESHYGITHPKIPPPEPLSVERVLPRLSSHPATKNSPLPPSVEKAYHQKCIDLKRRLRDVEASNEEATKRVHRVERSITKMRIERALILDSLRKKQQQVARDRSEEESPPQSPYAQEAHSHRKRTAVRPEPGHGPSPPALQSVFAQAAHHASLDNNNIMAHYAAPTQPYPGMTTFNIPGGRQISNPLAANNSVVPTGTLPLIHSLPNGTSVMLIAPGVPKPAPWTINELDPRHHCKPSFENLSLADQDHEIFAFEYLPFDHEGRPILLVRDPDKNRYVHIHPGDPRWEDPIKDSVRMDSKEFRHPATASGIITKNKWLKQQGKPTIPRPDYRSQAEKDADLSVSGSASKSGRAKPENKREAQSQSQQARRDRERAEKQAAKAEEDRFRNRSLRPAEEAGAGSPVAAAPSEDTGVKMEGVESEGGSAAAPAEGARRSVSGGRASGGGGGFTAANR